MKNLLLSESFCNARAGSDLDGLLTVELEANLSSVEGIHLPARQDPRDICVIKNMAMACFLT